MAQIAPTVVGRGGADWEMIVWDATGYKKQPQLSSTMAEGREYRKHNYITCRLSCNVQTELQRAFLFYDFKEYMSTEIDMCLFFSPILLLCMVLAEGRSWRC